LAAVIVIVEVVVGCGNANPPPQPINTAAALIDASMSATKITRRDHCSRSRLGIAKNSSASAGDPNGQSGAVREFAAFRATVWIVRTELAAPLPGITDEGEKLAVAPAGSPDAVRLTELLYGPPDADTLIWNTAEPP
jgi:hypothetical protein